jgi:hypothetical protein
MRWNLPGNIRIGHVRDRRHITAPRHRHDLRGLVDDDVEALLLEDAQSGGDRGRG